MIGEEFYSCPHCGEDVSTRAKMCRACGASDDCGWNDDFADGYAGEDDDGFDYDDFVAREFPSQEAGAEKHDRPWLRLVIFAILASLFFSMFSLKIFF